PLLKLPNVVATPHLGASTVEAQERVSTQTVEALLAALSGAAYVPAVNLPFRGPKDAEGAAGRVRLAPRAAHLPTGVLRGPPPPPGVRRVGRPRGAPPPGGGGGREGCAEEAPPSEAHFGHGALRGAGRAPPRPGHPPRGPRDVCALDAHLAVGRRRFGERGRDA